MSDELDPTSGQAVRTAAEGTPVPAQSVTPASNGKETSGQEEAKPEFLTRADAEQLVENAVNQMRSYADKGRVRVENEVKATNAAIAQMRALGQQITPEQEREMVAAATQKAILEPAPAEEPQGQVDPRLIAIQKAAGIELYDNDPEIVKLDRSHGEDAFFASVGAALNDKRTRLASQPANQPEAAGIRLPPGGSASSPVAANASQYWDRAYKKDGAS